MSAAPVSKAGGVRATAQNAGTAPDGSAIARSLSWMGVGHVVSQVFWFGSLIVLGMVLPPSGFGIVAVGLVMLWVANVLMGTGLRAAIIASDDVSAADVRGATVFTVGTGVLIAFALAALAGPIARTFAAGGEAMALRGIAAGVAFMGVTIVPMAVLDKRMAFKRSAAIKVTATLIASVAAIGAGIGGAGVWALVGRQVLYYLVVALLAWVAVRDLLPTGGSGVRRARLRRAGSRAFFALALSSFLAFTVDSLVVGRLTDSTQLGLYSFAFTLAFAPMTQFVWPIGMVLFPAAAATQDLAVVARRTLTVIRMIALILLPLVPAAIVLAPVVIPAMLGERWSGVVAPFQILLLAGVGHAILDCIGDAMSGTGGIWFRAPLHVVWAPVTVGSIAALTVVDGIRGAAIAHLALLVPLWGAYAARGVRLLGLRAADVWGAVRGVVVPVAAQAGVTAGVAGGLEAAGTSHGASAGLGAAAGLALVALLLSRGGSSPIREGRQLVATARSPAA